MQICFIPGTFCACRVCGDLCPPFCLPSFPRAPMGPCSLLSYKVLSTCVSLCILLVCLTGRLARLLLSSVLRILPFRLPSVIGVSSIAASPVLLSRSSPPLVPSAVACCYSDFLSCLCGRFLLLDPFPFPAFSPSPFFLPSTVGGPMVMLRVLVLVSLSFLRLAFLLAIAPCFVPLHASSPSCLATCVLLVSCLFLDIVCLLCLPCVSLVPRLASACTSLIPPECAVSPERDWPACTPL